MSMGDLLWYWYKSTAYAIKDRLMPLWHATQRNYYEEDAKRVYYFSMEFLMGRSLGNSMLNLGLTSSCKQALYSFGQDIEEVEEKEHDAGLGNGGLGHLASCYLDSMATLNIPGYGYGLRYEFGSFSQDIVGGGTGGKCGSLVAIWKCLGGGALGNDLSCAFWRRGKGFERMGSF
jgi:starch phosphorylase